MADTIRDVVIRLTIQQQDFRAKGLDLGELKKSLGEREKLFEESFRKTDELFKRFSKAGGGAGGGMPTAQFDEMAKKAADVEKKLAGLKNRTADFSGGAKTSMIGAADAFKTAGEGAFVLARGVAFLASDSEESFRDMLRNVARVQGSFDLFKGSVDTVKGMAQGLRQLGGAAGASGGLAQIAGLLFSPQGLLVAGVAAAATSLYALTREFITGGAAADRYAEQVERAAQQALAVQASIDANILSGSESFTANSSARRGALGESMRLRGLEGASGSNLDRQLGHQRFLLRDTLRERVARAARISADDPLMGQGAAGARNFAIQQASNVNVPLERRIALMKELQEFQQADIQFAREQIRLQEESVRNVQRERDEKQRALQVVKQQIEAEKQRIATAEAALGRMSVEDLMSLENIAKKVQGGGQISRVEAQFLEGTGLDFAQQHAQQFFQQAGQQRGFSEIAKAFGATDKVGEFERQADQIQNEIGRLNTLAERVQATLATNARDLREAIEGMIQDNLEGFIARLRQEFESRRQEQRNN